MYDIRLDHTARRLDLTLRGFWTDETMDRFAEDLAQAVAAAKTRFQAFDILSDASEFPVQTPAIVSRFGATMQSMETAAYGRIAVIVGTMLSKAQAERVEAGSVAKIFRERADALEWLAARD